MKLFKYKCGCIGTFDVNKKRQFIIVDCTDPRGISLGFRDFEDYPTEVPEGLNGEIILRLRSLVADGEKYREIKKLLK